MELNPLEQTVLKSYISKDDSLVNYYIRGLPLDPEDGEENPEKANKLAYLLRKILKKIKAKNSKQGSLFRGLKLPKKNFKENVQEGSILIDKAFMSTTLNEGSAKWFVTQDANRFLNHELVLYEIVEYRTARPIFGYMKQEVDGPEHLFLPNTRFKVLDVQRDAEGPHNIKGKDREVYIVKLKEVNCLGW